MEWHKILDFIKIHTKYYLTAFFGCSFLLFLPSKVLTELGLSNFESSYKTQIGWLWLLSLAILSSRGSWILIEWAKSKFVNWLSLKRYKKRLHELTAQEKEILRLYIDNNERSRDFHITNGIVLELEAIKVLRRASNISRAGTSFPYNIQPWAFRYLQSNPDLIRE